MPWDFMFYFEYQGALYGNCYANKAIIISLIESPAS